MLSQADTAAGRLCHWNGGVMDPDIKQRWVAALRSGNYSQTIGFLRNEDGYCCLGVLCDIKNPEEWSANCEGNYAFFGATGQLPEDVYRWAELPGCNPDVIIPCGECKNGKNSNGYTCQVCYGSGDGGSTLSGLNDYSRWTFDRIADVIEEQL